MRLRSAALLAVLAATGCTLGPAGGLAAESPPATSWTEVEAALDEQRLADALKGIEALEARARRSGDEAGLARSLVRATQVRIALGGYETAAEALLAADWPAAGLPRVEVELQAAHALRAYLDAYRWEIASREIVAGDAAAPLREWTLETIAERITALYDDAEGERDALGAIPPSALETLEPNDYPDGVRPTARDAVTYLFASHLADSGLWPPGTVGRLATRSVEALLEPPPEVPAAHPLVRAAGLLVGLEGWHRGRGELAAALEARIERHGLVRAALESPSRRREVRERLGASLTPYENDPWWSMARARLASMVREEARPEALTEARDLATAGERRHPGSPGAAACRALRQELEAPSYALEAMRVDAPGRRSVAVRHRNLPRLYLRAHRLEPLSVEDTFARGGWTDERVDALVASRPVAEWTVDLAPTPDLREHRTYVTPPLDRPGRYVLLVAPGPTFRRSEGIRQAVELEVSDLVLLADVERGERPAVVVRALSGATGDPVAGARMTLVRSWRRDRPETVAETVTDPSGLARFEIEGPSTDRRGIWAVVAKHGEDEATWGPFGADLGSNREPDARRRALLFTDRAAYRPGQTVHFKALLFAGDAAEGRLRALPGAAAEVRLRDPNGDVVERRELATNDFGSASGELTIASGRLLGLWSLETDEASVALRVEEYRRPTFEVTLDAPDGEPALGDRVELRGLAETYFGRPLAGAAVRWRVERRALRPIEPWAFLRAPWPPAGPPEIVAWGDASTGADGRFEIGFDADGGDAPDEAAVPFAVSVSVIDPGGETRDAERVVALGRAGIALTAADAPFLVAPGATPELALARRAGDAPRAGRSTWTLVALQAPERPALPAELRDDLDPLLAGAATDGDRRRPRWAHLPAPQRLVAGWTDGATVAAGELEHGEDGVSLWRPGTLAAGAYRAVFRSADARGRESVLERPLLVLPRGADAPLALDVRFAEPCVAVGGSARLELRSGFVGQAVTIEVLRGDVVRERRLWVAGRDPSTIEIPIRPGDRGGLGVRATLVRDHQRVDAAARLEVPWDDRELRLELESFRDRLEPGERTRLRLRVRDASGRPVEEGGAELVAAIADRSLDLFARLDWPRPAALYPAFGAPPPWRTNLGASGAVWWGWSDVWRTDPFPGFQSDRPATIDPYGVGGPGPRGGPRVFRQAATAAPTDTAAPPLESLAVSAAPAAEPSAEPVPVELRDDFAETALWAPHLVTGPDGSVAVEAEMPDSLTSWTFRAAAWTRDLAGGLLERQLTTARDLVVRPYLPRFVREGDHAEIRVVVESSADEPLVGDVRFAIVDPANGDDVSASFGLDEAESRRFALEPRGSAELRFPIVAPERLDEVAVRVEARAGGRSDGELRPLPVLPARVRLTRSRFATLHGAERRALRFEELREAESGRVDEQLVVTVDAQLVESVLAALPYLVDYPYECTEQTMNRFVATAILDRLFERSPELARAAREIAAARGTEVERFDAPDPNRALALEETPWRVESGGGRDDEAVRRILDPEVARAVRDEALARLRTAQLPSGAFPWFAGGPASPYMTLYLMAGFARAAELGAEIPADVVRRGWAYLEGEIDRDWWRNAIDGDCCWELLTAANFVAGSYPDPALVGELLPPKRRREILDVSFRHWRRHAPRLKLQLAVTLARAGRAADARTVLESVFDSARSDRDVGLHWAPEERAWLWYNDDIETHAEALRALLAVAPDDPRADGLVQWLFLQKKLGHWKSTRATAEVLASLVSYLDVRGELGEAQEVIVQAGGATAALHFEPGGGLDRRQRVVVPGDRLVPRRDAEVVVEQSTPGLAFASATWSFTTDRLPEAGDGDLLAVRRSWFVRRLVDGRPLVEPLAEGAAIAVGDEVEVRLSLTARAPAEYLHLRDPRPSGLEPVSLRSGWRRDLGLPYYEETRDSGTSFFFERLPAGEITLRHRLRAAVAGTFRAAPAELRSIYAPEFAAHSAGDVLEVLPDQSSK